MSEVQNLIKLATQELENMNNSTSMVGNRPHYPMFIMSNNMANEEMHGFLYHKMRRIWPQTVSKLIFSSYSVDGSGYRLTDNDGNILSEDGIKIKIDEINNLGVVKIRLRSMQAAIEEQTAEKGGNA